MERVKRLLKSSPTCDRAIPVEVVVECDMSMSDLSKSFVGEVEVHSEVLFGVGLQGGVIDLHASMVMEQDFVIAWGKDILVGPVDVFLFVFACLKLWRSPIREEVGDVIGGGWRRESVDKGDRESIEGGRERRSSFVVGREVERSGR